MEEDSTNGFDMRQYKHEGDKMMEGVMPSSWEGHARIAIRDSDDVPESIEEKAIGKALNLSEKKGTTPKRAAKGLIKALAEKQE